MGMTNTGISAKELQEYEAVFASVTRTTYFADSGGKTETGGVYVLWDDTGGFTGTGWHKDTPYSPSNGFSEKEFEEDMRDGNLNDMFGSWDERVPIINNRLEWLMNLPDRCKQNA